MYIYTYRYIYRQADKNTNRTERDIFTQAGIQRQSKKQIQRETEKATYRKTGRQKDRETYRDI